ncbi:MAG: hypothetical protein OEZ01_08885 [Candidatus Heimdallarchaeota archaeon]|nr:hypothetical protein [Candidatus Heimdallarchaeota archaeon]MDH5646109.1 hypothetical protein [Candidatus Heimdallarchaeota archaeon]
MVPARSFYMFIVEEESYQELKKLRELRVNGDQAEKFQRIEISDHALIAIRKNEFITIVAEYEIDQCRVGPKIVYLHLEPIYNAPIHNGLKFNSVIYSTLTTFENPEMWTRKIRDPLVKMDESDFKILVKKLTA